MAMIKRAGASCLALMLAAGGLLGIHHLLHVARGQNGKPSAAKHELSLKAAVGTKKRSRDAAFGTPAGPPKESAEAPAFYLASDFDPASVGEILATSGQTAPAPAPVPAPMPAPANAVPLPPSSEDWPLPTPSAKRDASPETGKESNPRRASSGRRIIDRELPNTSSEERDLWHEQTKDLSLNDLRELMRIRAGGPTVGSEPGRQRRLCRATAPASARFSRDRRRSVFPAVKRQWRTVNRRAGS